MNTTYVIATISFLTSLSTPIFIVPVLGAAGVIDVPSSRSSHLVPTVRGVGIAPGTGVAVASVLAIVTSNVDWVPVLVMLVSIIAGCIGFFEDLNGLSIRARIASQFTLGFCFAALLCDAFARTFVWMPLIAFLFASYINVANFMDGINGISATHGIIVGLHFTAVGYFTDQAWLSMIGLVLVSVFAGFLPWNIGPRSVFLGDAGSYLLGALVVGICVSGLGVGIPLLLAFAPLLPYLSDTSCTLIARIIRKEDIRDPHRKHVYQLLAALLDSHLASTAIIAITSVLCSLISFLNMTHLLSTPLAILLCLVVLASYISLPNTIRTWSSLWSRSN